MIALTFAAITMTKDNPDHVEIKRIVSEFMALLKKKDEAKFLALFAEGAVAWCGITKPQSFKYELEADPKAKDWYTATPKQWYKALPDTGDQEEKFSNVKISGDETIASVMFDYSYWSKGVKQNWGKESWAMVKQSGKWKITRVIFSMEYPQPAKTRG